MKILVSRKHKNSKLLYYLKGYLRELLPGRYFRNQLQTKLQSLEKFEADYIFNRVNYYNKLDRNQNLPESTNQLSGLKIPKKFKVYYFDSYEYLRFFKPSLRASFLFGDITHIPDLPSIVKSRPIHGSNQNSVLLKLNKVRHFMFVNDLLEFNKKENLLVGRAVVKHEHRIRFYDKYFNHSLCDLGQINQGTSHDRWLKNRLTIDEHLKYKFILCLEGYDVASNLKWVMSSNSLAVMPEPKFETWFMEGTLIPDYHYVRIKDDFSDLEDRLNHYINHPEEALAIIKNANDYVNQFKDPDREDLVSLLVLKKYFEKTSQQTEATS